MRMAGDTLGESVHAARGALAGLAQPSAKEGGGIVEGFFVDGELISLDEVKRGYQMGDHIVDAGPGQLFWASNIQTTQTLQPKPLEHGLQILSRHGASRLDLDTIRDQQQVRTQQASRLHRLMASGAKELPRDPRDYRTDDGLMRSELLPLGMTIDAATRKGLWS